ncbi:armadillo repeat containing 1, like isoform X2 [Pygocentrus nattereri]|uniref:armadillo repeat containing 1, like isoform X2 n=1 Tax=Pygocentrus nattereri TaxID=42514 RepID=UPI0008149E49|nr:armadillo repeat containing 1, like isoform X2 [Pygocentrus nattereri]
MEIRQMYARLNPAGQCNAYAGTWRGVQRSSRMMDALSVVSQLRDLASEPQNREIIVRDQGCLPGLVLFLDHKDPQVVFTTLQTLRYLAESTQNINTMKNELGMMVTLEALKENGLNNDITDLAKEVHEVLSNLDTYRTPEQTKRRNKHQFFINSSNKKAKSITLHIQGLDGTDQRGVCEEALLKVKGVISFTFQMALKRCTVRVRADLPTEVSVQFNCSLASAIAATKMLSAQQVVKNESGEEVLIPLSTTDLKVEENSHLPDYLPEDESPEKETDRAVSRTTAKQDSSGSWLNTAASFLTKTFYW